MDRGHDGNPALGEWDQNSADATHPNQNFASYQTTMNNHSHGDAPSNSGYSIDVGRDDSLANQNYAYHDGHGGVPPSSGYSAHNMTTARDGHLNHDRGFQQQVRFPCFCLYLCYYLLLLFTLHLQL